MDKPIECKSEEGVLVGLIDSIMTLATVAAERVKEYDEDQIPDSVIAALADLFQDRDLRFVVSFGGNSKYGPSEFEEICEQLHKDVEYLKSL